MFAFTYLLSSLFLFPAFLGSAAPTVDTSRSDLVRRAQYCSNAPSVRAGTKMPINPSGRIYPLPTIFNIIWCTPDTKTYLIINPGSPIASELVINLLTGAGKAAAAQIAGQGDRMVQNGRFTWSQHMDRDVVLQVTNANNHQVTYGVLSSALRGLQDYMWNCGYGGVQFKLYDGSNQVGRGSINYD